MAEIIIRGFLQSYESNNTSRLCTKILAFVPWLVKSLNLAIVLDKALREISLFIWKAPYFNISL
jgi:hypothetical protein